MIYASTNNNKMYFDSQNRVGWSIIYSPKIIIIDKDKKNKLNISNLLMYFRRLFERRNE